MEILAEQKKSIQGMNIETVMLERQKVKSTLVKQPVVETEQNISDILDEPMLALIADTMSDFRGQEDDDC